MNFVRTLSDVQLLMIGGKLMAYYVELAMIADGLIEVCTVKIGKFGEQDSVQDGLVEFQLWPSVVNVLVLKEHFLMTMIWLLMMFPHFVALNIYKTNEPSSIITS